MILLFLRRKIITWTSKQHNCSFLGRNLITWTSKNRVLSHIQVQRLAHTSRKHMCIKHLLEVLKFDVKLTSLYYDNHIAIHINSTQRSMIEPNIQRWIVTQSGRVETGKWCDCYSICGLKFFIFFTNQCARLVQICYVTNWDYMTYMPQFQGVFFQFLF